MLRKSKYLCSLRGLGTAGNVVLQFGTKDNLTSVLEDESRFGLLLLTNVVLSARSSDIMSVSFSSVRRHLLESLPGVLLTERSIVRRLEK